ncbi:MAG: hypothetical protein CVU88_03260 [Firmicutes bacterium HGW-Firmicutes-13]|nr:MAG: hypothetical protein CVU88_03260 [Firmicutes bacterium HGW-Firmicutes-13]
MEVIYGIEKYYKQQPLVLALGNFDGVHRGHRQILRVTKQKAGEIKAESGVLIFDPHPLNILKPSKEILLLTTFTQRSQLIEELGIDLLIVVSFNREFASLSPEQFVKEILIDKLHAEVVVVGFDYSFGYGGSGKVNNLKELGKRFGFKVEVVEPVTIKNKVVSSSLIRGLISSGKVEEASLYLGNPPCIEGKVIHGEGRGKFLGFPTANLEVKENVVIPGNGVYLTLASFQGSSYYSLTNIGCKPTFGGDNLTIEVFIIGFQDNLYEHELRIKFLQKIREEKTFSNSEGLKAQIIKDLKKAEEIIQKYSINLSFLA